MIPENSGSLAHSYVHEHLDANHCECQVLEAVIAHNDVGGGSVMASVERRDGTWPKTHPIPIHIHRGIPSKQVSMNKSNTRLDQDFLVVLTLQIRRNKQLTSSRFQSAIGDQTPVHPVPNLGQVMDRKSRPAECYLISTTLSLSATAAVPTKGRQSDSP